MDDILLIGTSSKDIHKAVKLIIQDAKKMGITIKENWFIRKISFQDRKNENDFIDMMGIKIYRTHIT